VAPHGVQGAVKVLSFADPPQSLLQHRHWRVRRADGGESSMEVVWSQWDQHGARVRLEGINDRDAAAALRDCEVLIEREQRAPAASHEYYREDLEGFTVRNAEGVDFGTLQHFLEAPAGPLMVVRGERERWLPASPPYLRRVDLQRREIEVDWPADF